MNLKTFLAGLAADQRAAFAVACGTTPSMLQQIAGGHKRIELGFADALVAVSRGAIALSDLPLTDRARTQLAIRQAFARPRRSRASAAPTA